MAGLLSVIATAILLGLIAWFAGGLILRIAGCALAICGLLLTATAGSPSAALGALLGMALWLAGHWSYAARHHYFRSPLARRIFLTALPARLDPTCGWGVPTTTPESQR